MQLKMDDKGNVVLQEGLPVYAYDDGREAPFDARTTLDTLNKRILNLEDEKTRHFNGLKEAKEKLKIFDGIDPEHARAAITTVQNLKDKQLLDSQGIEVLKSEMRSSFDGEKRQLTDSFTNTLKEKDDSIAAQNATIHNLVVTQRFHGSEFFAGDKPKTIYPPEDAAKIFGHHFTVEQKPGDNNPRVIAKDSDGHVILSRKNHGDPAGFDEAISIIIDKHPNKHRFLSSPGEGGPPGSRSNTNNGSGGEEGTGQSKIASGLKKNYANRF